MFKSPSDEESKCNRPIRSNPLRAWVQRRNGAYDNVYGIVDPSITPAPPLLATSALAVSQFSGDPAGTLYADGIDAHSLPAHNTDWIYQGIPTNPKGQVAQESVMGVDTVIAWRIRIKDNSAQLALPAAVDCNQRVSIAGTAKNYSSVVHRQNVLQYRT